MMGYDPSTAECIQIAPPRRNDHWSFSRCHNIPPLFPKAIRLYLKTLVFCSRQNSWQLGMLVRSIADPSPTHTARDFGQDTKRQPTQTYTTICQPGSNVVVVDDEILDQMLVKYLSELSIGISRP